MDQITPTPLPGLGLPDISDWSSLAKTLLGLSQLFVGSPILMGIGLIGVLGIIVAGYFFIKKKITDLEIAHAQAQTQAGKDTFMHDQIPQNQANAGKDNQGRDDLENTK